MPPPWHSESPRGAASLASCPHAPAPHRSRRAQRWCGGAPRSRAPHLASRLSRTTSFTCVSAPACVVALALAGVTPSAAARKRPASSIARHPRRGRLRSQPVVRGAAPIGRPRSPDRNAHQDDGRRPTPGGTAAIDRRCPGGADLRRRRPGPRRNDGRPRWAATPSRSAAGPRSSARRTPNGQHVHRRAQRLGRRPDRGAAELRDARAELEPDHAATSRARRQALDSELASLELRSSKAADRSVLAAADRPPKPREPLAAHRDRHRPDPATTPHHRRRPDHLRPPHRRTPPRRFRRQVSPHHDDPFLVCTRARRERRLRRREPERLLRRLVSAPTTWNVTAAHAGRLDLVGVLPSGRAGVRPGRDGVDAVPVAGHRPVGRPLLDELARPTSARRAVGE